MIGRMEAIAFTERGERLLRSIELPGWTIGVSRGYGAGKTPLADWTEAAFRQAEALLFAGAAAIAVRAVAPHLGSKLSDPAVLAVDEGGQFVIPLLSGHIGGANRLAEQLAAAIGATPVITTATDRRGLFAVDSWAVEQRLAIVHPAAIKRVSARLLAGQPVRAGGDFPVLGTPPRGVVWTEEDAGADILLSIEDRPDTGQLQLVPPAVVLGIGCRRGIDGLAIERAVSRALAQHRLRPEAVSAVCSIDCKREEAGLLAFCRRWNLPFQTYTAGELAGVAGDFSRSDFVRASVGVDNVCERAAVLGSGGRLLFRKTAMDGVTVAAARKPLTIRWEEGE